MNYSMTQTINATGMTNVTTTITVELTVQHKPGTKAHLQQVVLNYLRSKGCVIKDGKLII